ncbi:flavin reductase family protein [Bacillus sp. Marseille-P3661]|uniref:flavin reductase family protein n=1 Tax=Bacillus sp. Marseille-P3661 TaxID=1936234 RepID=UPI0015E1B0E0|nr:flavin reductase family protein [Bacillus sp. Marseille-P3661]
MHSKTHNEFANNVYKERIRGSLFIATSDGERAHFHFGCWSTQCSHEPPRMLTCFPKDFEGYDIVRKGGVWTVSMVPEDHKDFHDAFFLEGKQDIKSLGEDQFIYRETGCPILADAVGYFECKLVSLIDNGDFGIAIGDIITAEMLNSDKKNVTVNEVLARGFLDNRPAIKIPTKGFNLKI